MTGSNTQHITRVINVMKKTSLQSHKNYFGICTEVRKQNGLCQKFIILLLLLVGCENSTQWVERTKLQK